MITSLASVPEFQILLNRIVKNNLSLLDEELGYLLMYPSLLNLENKLYICHKALVHLDAEASMDEKYPLISAANPNDESHHKTQPLYIYRTERGHWEQFCDFVMGRRDMEGALTALSPLMQHSSHSSTGDGSILKPRQRVPLGRVHPEPGLRVHRDQQAAPGQAPPPAWRCHAGPRGGGRQR